MSENNYEDIGVDNSGSESMYTHFPPFQDRINASTSIPRYFLFTSFASHAPLYVDDSTPVVLQHCYFCRIHVP